MLETRNKTLLKGFFQKVKSCFSLKTSLLFKTYQGSKVDMQNQQLIVLECLGHLANREKHKKNFHDDNMDWEKIVVMRIIRLCI